MLRVAAFHGDAQAPVAGSAAVPRPVDPRDRESSAFSSAAARLVGQHRSRNAAPWREADLCLTRSASGSRSRRGESNGPMEVLMDT
jgi:hypothetical protein